MFHLIVKVLRRPFFNLNKRPLSVEMSVTCPIFCTTTNERVYITARAFGLEFGGTQGLQAAGAGGL